MSKHDVIKFIGSLLLAGLILNMSLIILSISWEVIFISNVALVILYGISEYREQKRLKEEGVPLIDERVVNKMKSYFAICITSFVFLFIMYLSVNKYLDRQIVDVNELLYIVIFGLLISMASTSVLATREIK
ncbi:MULTISPECIES: ATPase [Bacillus]|uniref:ATPase n=1 Tax=Bacillus TaxID=1386 RepID=UPI001C018156|nr:ATPase [Bacillus mycoides]QWH20105.1 ATPase [Bacillus mycoides]